jgi:hypothetical protein
MGDKLDSVLFIRVTEKLKEDFKKKSEKHGGVNHVHRELIKAFVEGRVTIAPPKLYN